MCLPTQPCLLYSLGGVVTKVVDVYCSCLRFTELYGMLDAVCRPLLFKSTIRLLTMTSTQLCSLNRRALVQQYLGWLFDETECLIGQSEFWDVPILTNIVSNCLVNKEEKCGIWTQHFDITGHLTKTSLT